MIRRGYEEARKRIMAKMDENEKEGRNLLQVEARLSVFREYLDRQEREQKRNELESGESDGNEKERRVEEVTKMEEVKVNEQSVGSLCMGNP
ncbi:hypothetical protein N0V83_010724 [Neocucurbitaria cava]|uniref:Uncharacterized protein n=1 Tax=Neocucurbitaria cava TaxID=798079 RepID=A0A9W9CGY9_9PLEO|nr:hypothetical protein N0V83_010724 [Neocucurbitaria cava]